MSAHLRGDSFHKWPGHTLCLFLHSPLPPAASTPAGVNIYKEQKDLLSFIELWSIVIGFSKEWLITDLFVGFLIFLKASYLANRL